MDARVMPELVVERYSSSLLAGEHERAAALWFCINAFSFSVVRVSLGNCLLNSSHSTRSSLSLVFVETGKNQCLSYSNPSSQSDLFSSKQIAPWLFGLSSPPLFSMP